MSTCLSALASWHGMRQGLCKTAKSSQMGSLCITAIRLQGRERQLHVHLSSTCALMNSNAGHGQGVRGSCGESDIAATSRLCKNESDIESAANMASL